MNDKRTGLEQTLEQATAPSDAPQRDLGPEAQSLREAWLAFGRLLEAAQPHDNVPLLRRSSARQNLRSLLGLRQAVAHVAKKYGLAAALAASLLIGVSIYWMSDHGAAPSGVPPTADQTVTTQGVKPSAAAVAQNPAVPAAGDLQWDDSFDQQIAEAGQSVALAQSDLAHAFDASDLVRYQLYQTEQEFEKNKL
jgi:hypothetical protein